MKKLIILSIILLFLSSGSCVIAQTIVNRAGASNTVADSRHQATLNSFLPRYADTTAANVSKGIDSCGARIFTYSPLAIWYRGCSPKRWIRSLDVENFAGYIDTAQNQAITNITIIDDDHVEICTGDGSCDTLTISTTINNISSVYFLNDSSIVVCDSLLACDTVTIPQQDIFYYFQNGLSVIGGNIIEHGGELVHATQLSTEYTDYTIVGKKVGDYFQKFKQAQSYGYSTGIASFLHQGSSFGTAIDYENLVTLGINYTGDTASVSPYKPGYMGDKIGYMLNVNATGAPVSGMLMGNQYSKIGGLFFHTLDTAYADAVTIFGAKQPLASSAYNLLPNTMDSTRIAVFKHSKQVQFKGYGAGTREAVPNTVSGWDANGNFVEVDTADMGGSVTFIDSTKIIICSFGNYLCDTIYTTEGGLMSIYAANGLTKRNDSTLILGGTLDQTTTIDATGSYGLIVTGSSANTVLTGKSTSVGVGVYGESDGGYAIYGKSNTGTGGYFQTNPTSTNTVAQSLLIGRSISGGGTAANGIGASIDMSVQSVSSAQIANQIISKWTDATTATRTSQLVITGVNSGSTVDKLYIGGAATQVNATRFETYQGAAVVAANDLTLGTDGNLFSITGNTQINAITTANWQAGSEIGFIFTGTPTLKNNTAGGAGTATMLLAGRVDYVAAAGDYIAFRYDGTNWYETQRKVAASGGTYTFTNGLTESPAGTVKLGGTLSDATTTLTGGANKLAMTFNTLAGTNGLDISSTSTAAASGAQKLVSVALSGANTNASEQTSALYVSNSHSGTTPVNIAVYGSVTNGTSTSMAIYGEAAAGQTAVKGSSTSGFGVWGVSGSGVGVRGESSSNTAIVGVSSSGIGITANSTSTLASTFTINPSSTNSVAENTRIVRTTSGTAADGIGTSVDYYIEADNGTAYLSTQLISKLTTAANATRTSQFVATGVNSGSTVDILTLSGLGYMQLNPITATAASAITAADGMIVYVNSTNGTFTSVGFWSRENGVWVKM